jgi:hypothetical protein
MDLKSYSRLYDYSRARDAMFAVTDTGPAIAAHSHAVLAGDTASTPGTRHCLLPPDGKARRRSTRRHCHHRISRQLNQARRVKADGYGSPARTKAPQPRHEWP